VSIHRSRVQQKQNGDIRVYSQKPDQIEFSEPQENRDVSRKEMFPLYNVYKNYINSKWPSRKGLLTHQEN
jgi:hypothetical protein